MGNRAKCRATLAASPVRAGPANADSSDRAIAGRYREPPAVPLPTGRSVERRSVVVRSTHAIFLADVVGPAGRLLVLLVEPLGSSCARPVSIGTSALSFSRVQLLLMQKEIKTLIWLREEVVRFVETLAPIRRGATLITLSGELGAGKTTFVKAVARALGVEKIVNSPTFVLEKIYMIPGHLFKRLVHVDAYRLERGADLIPLGFEELMKDPDNLILLEWPENVADALPVPSVKISFVANPDGSRTISYG